MLVGHRLSQTDDWIVRRERHSRHRRRDGRGDLGRRHIDQSGVGHRLPGSGDKRPRRLFVAKQAQDVVHKRGHVIPLHLEALQLLAAVCGALQ